MTTPKLTYEYPHWHAFAAGWIAAVPHVIKHAVMVRFTQDDHGQFWVLTDEQEAKAEYLEQKLNARFSADMDVFERDMIETQDQIPALIGGDRVDLDMDLSWIESLEQAPANIQDVVDATLEQALAVMQAMWPEVFA